MGVYGLITNFLEPSGFSEPIGALKSNSSQLKLTVTIKETAATMTTRGRKLGPLHPPAQQARRHRQAHHLLTIWKRKPVATKHRPWHFLATTVAYDNKGNPRPAVLTASAACSA